MNKKKPMTAAELMAELEKDPAFVERRRQKEEARRRKEEELRRAEAPLVEELRSAGEQVSSAWDLLKITRPYTKILPILLDHLQRPYPDEIRDGIARALGVPEARFAWPVLVRLYRQEPPSGTRDGLAVAIGIIADDELIGEVIDLARDPRLGESRLLLLHRLAKSRDPRARKALMELGADPQLYKEVQFLLRRKKRAERK